ncbi:FecR domain-containing protein [Roseospira visakhapatnamensis]|uniref:FecR protein domain-containing protein n=1 Tax=Roseospira visakhapatnamensis TaxID=390880 RepID=A0A7W6RCM3_9PROT|nr:FecR domain-containing protein [Roseospira visakhapatnamensis]MBB4266064.1 hypothetical protein [Roseospira visakhapatnamensis]
MRGVARRCGIVPGILLLAALVVVVMALLTRPAAADTVGTVARVQGEAFARAEAARTARSLAVGDTVDSGDMLTTGAGARLEIALADGGTLQLGADAAFVVDALALGDGPEGALSTAMRLFNGPFRLMGTHAGGQVVTRAAVIGIRGTDVWGGVIDGGFGVLLQDGIVDVITPGGVATLDTPGEGVMVFQPREGPRDQRIWGAAKVARAVASVTVAE